MRVVAREAPLRNEGPREGRFLQQDVPRHRCVNVCVCVCVCIYIYICMYVCIYIYIHVLYVPYSVLYVPYSAHGKHLCDMKDHARAVFFSKTSLIIGAFPWSCRGTSLIRNCFLLEPYSRPMHRALRWS